jgi:hypothetical protein
VLIQSHPLGTTAFLGGTPANLTEFTSAWGRFVAFNERHVVPPDGGWHIHLDESSHSYHAEARNDLVARFQGQWLFQTDSDHKIAPDALWRLLVTATKTGARVVTGFYQKKKPPYEPTLYKAVHGAYLVIGEWPDEPFNVDACGAGCLLVYRDVFLTINKELGQKPFAQSGDQPEDLSFCRRLNLLGIPIVCDPRIQHPHLKIDSVRPSDLELGSGVLDPAELQADHIF